MNSNAPTVSEIRTAKDNAVGGGRKRCVKGKNCSAACIQAGMVCLVEMPESAGIAVGKLRDYLMGARDKLVGTQTPSGRQVPGEFQPLRTPKEAADWLIKHKDEIAMWGIDENRVDAVLKHKPKYITVGIEPGTGEKGAAKLQELVPELRNLPQVRDSGLTNKQGVMKRNTLMDDEMQKVNNYKLAMELSNHLTNQNSEVFGKGYNMVLTDYLKSGFDVDKWITDLEKNGVLEKGVIKDLQKRYQIPQGGSSWGRGNKILAESAEVGKAGDFMGLLNPSGAWKPMADYSQFNELFKQAGYSREQAGPFVSQGDWLKYSANSVKDRFQKILTQGKPEFVYLANAGRDNEALVNIVKSEAQGGRGTFTVSTMSKANKPVERKLEYFLYNHPDGTRTVMMAGPHPSTLAFGSQEALVKATGEIAKSLRMRGELPTSVSDPSVRIQRLESPGDRIQRGSRQQRPVSEKVVQTKLPLQSNGLAERLVNLPNGQFNANDLWKAMDEHNQDKRKKDWVPQMRSILKAVRDEQGGLVSKGPKADEVRRRAQEAGLLPKSTPSKTPDEETPEQRKARLRANVIEAQNPSFSEVFVRPKTLPSTRWDLRQRPRLLERPSKLG